MKIRRKVRYLLPILMLLLLAGCRTGQKADTADSGIGSTAAQQAATINVTSEIPEDAETDAEEPDRQHQEDRIDRLGIYDQAEDVALFLVTYGELPENYVTKAEAKKHGWSGGSVEPYLFEGACIGGDYFGNYEGNLPEDQSYRECDVDTIGKKSRGAKRLIYTEDISEIYYTEDHYDSFTLLYQNGIQITD